MRAAFLSRFLLGLANEGIVALGVVKKAAKAGCGSELMLELAFGIFVVFMARNVLSELAFSGLVDNDVLLMEVVLEFLDGCEMDVCFGSEIMLELALFEYVVFMAGYVLSELACSGFDDNDCLMMLLVELIVRDGNEVYDSTLLE